MNLADRSDCIDEVSHDFVIEHVFGAGQVMLDRFAHILHFFRIIVVNPLDLLLQLSVSVVDNFDSG